VNRKIPVLLVQEDLAARGIDPAELIPGVTLVPQSAIAGLFAEHELVSHG
jgi:hypothetical protein